MARLGRICVLAGGMLAACLLPRCQVIGGFDGHRVVDPAGPGGAVGTGGDATGGFGGMGGAGGDDELPDQCLLSKAPEPPRLSDEGDDTSLVLAVRSIEIGEDLDEDFGFDLDGACTCADESCPCATEASACNRPTILASDDDWARCDEVGGVDANSKQVFQLVNTFDDKLDSDAISEGIELGLWSSLFELRGYNGEANDDKVFVAVYSAGAFAAADCNVGSPTWSGNDVWPIDVESVVGALDTCGEMPSPVTFDEFAYVVDHQAVARFDELTMVAQLDTVTLRLVVHDARIVAPLSRDAGGPWTVSGGLLVGRWLLPDVAQAVAAIDDLTILDLCEPVAAATVESSVCRYVDERYDVTNLVPDDPCDAMSFALRFDAMQAATGHTVGLPPSKATCPALMALDCAEEP